MDNIKLYTDAGYIPFKYNNRIGLLCAGHISYEDNGKPDWIHEYHIYDKKDNRLVGTAICNHKMDDKENIKIDIRDNSVFNVLYEEYPDIIHGPEEFFKNLFNNEKIDNKLDIDEYHGEDFNTTCFAKVYVFTTPGMLSDKKINMETIPDELSAYEIEHAPDDIYNPIKFSETVHNNFYGTFISTKEVPLNDDGTRHINMASNPPDIRYMCHNVVFGADYKEFFESCV